MFASKSKSVNGPGFGHPWCNRYLGGGSLQFGQRDGDDGCNVNP